MEFLEKKEWTFQQIFTVGLDFGAFPTQGLVP